MPAGEREELPAPAPSPGPRYTHLLPTTDQARYPPDTHSGLSVHPPSYPPPPAQPQPTKVLSTPTLYPHIVVPTDPHPTPYPTPTHPSRTCIYHTPTHPRLTTHYPLPIHAHP
ncbi:proline-rich protein 2-like [Penaeus indicus]|uniref:proline-rich protein 2-like n=1 Tax=Penaeus indicus TaxID=29960 RepID=UPI00300D97E1